MTTSKDWMHDRIWVEVDKSTHADTQTHTDTQTHDSFRSRITHG